MDSNDESESHRNAEPGTWTFLVQRGDYRQKQEALEEPVSTLSSMEDNRLVSWLSLATMLMGLASLGTWGNQNEHKGGLVDSELGVGWALNTSRAAPLSVSPILQCHYHPCLKTRTLWYI